MPNTAAVTYPSPALATCVHERYCRTRPVTTSQFHASFWGAVAVNNRQW